MIPVVVVIVGVAEEEEKEKEDCGSVGRGSDDACTRGRLGCGVTKPVDPVMLFEEAGIEKEGMVTVKRRTSARPR